MPNTPLPALALAAIPGRRKRTLELAQEIERRGYAGIYCASVGDALGLCEGIALSTTRIPFGTAIANMYTRHVYDYAQTASLVHELSGGRFYFGAGVSHGPMNDRLGIRTGKPLVLATLRKKMIALAGEVADGIVFANTTRSTLPDALSALPAAKRADPRFYIGNMLPTCISDDRVAAAAVNRRTFAMYLNLPNYRNAWRDAGYASEIAAVEQAIAGGERGEKLSELMGERWLKDISLYGSAKEVREGYEAWLDAGMRTPILVPSSAQGNQFAAFEELFAAFA
jgi:alkanesulfonate monooxygenase SsuD/methylene tetrahydromethanopterin reductase-like flavin-dependent oxidoreductase (luciferase family)